MKIAIIGVGAMGCLFASKLTPWADVTMFGNWPEQLAALEKDGITLHHADGGTSQTAVRVTNRVDEIAGTELALILVKSYQTARAAREAGQMLQTRGLALTLQNGFNNLETLATVLGRQRVALGVTAQGATVLGPGHVRHAGHGPTYLAKKPQTVESLTQIAKLLNKAGMETQLVDDPDGLVWGKLVINAGINPITAILRVPNGFLAENELACKVMGMAAEEAATVGREKGIQLPFGDAKQRTFEVAQATAANHSSMLQDVLRGAPTEIDSICGAIVAHGARLGLPTPINKGLLEMVRELTAKKSVPQLAESPDLSALRTLLSDASTGALQ